MTETGETLNYGVARCGDARFAIPMSNLAEVAQVNDLFALPRPAQGLQGVFNLRGDLVPVYDLSILSGSNGQSSTGHAPRFAAILKSSNALLGLGIDQIEGLIRVPSTDLQSMAYAAGAERASETEDAREPGHRAQETGGIVRGTLLHEGTLLSVVSPEDVFAHPDLLSVKSRSLGARALKPASVESGATEGGEIPMLIFTAGGAEYALRATAIQGTVPKTEVETNALTSGACIGSIQYHGQRAPLLRTTEITGLGSSDTAVASEIVMLRLENGARVGLAVDAIRCMRAAKASKVQPAPPVVQGSESVVSGVLPPEKTESQVFVLCPEKLQRHALVQSMARMSTVASTADRKEQKLKRQGSDVVPESIRHLVFNAGTLLAAPAAQILRILPPPDLVTPWNSATIPGVEGVFRLDEGPVLYVDLARRLGLVSDQTSPGRVLLVASGGHRVGFAVSDVQGIDTSQWRRSSRLSGQTGTIVQLGSARTKRILPALDMQKLADGLCA